MERPAEGYTIVIGVPWRLWPLVDIPLVSLERSDRARCAEVILAIDATPGMMRKMFGAGAVERTLERFGGLRPRALHYGARQRWASAIVRWNWVDCWLTWVMGLAETRTRHALLHDFDAVVVDPEFLERHYDLALRTGSPFVGLRKDGSYASFGGDTALMTIELLVDAAMVRERFRPVDLFNRVRRWRGMRIECDILRDVQLRSAETPVVHELSVEQLVHPSQLVSHWRLLGRPRKAPFRPVGYTPLPLIPYFRFVAGEAAPMAALAGALERGERVVEIEGGRVDLSALDEKGRAWIVEQIERLDRFFAGSVRAPVERLCAAMAQGQGERAATVVETPAAQPRVTGAA